LQATKHHSDRMGYVAISAYIDQISQNV